jgi:hypothetical protein
MTTERNLREELLNQNGIGVQKGADLRDKVLARDEAAVARMRKLTIYGWILVAGSLLVAGVTRLVLYLSFQDVTVSKMLWGPTFIVAWQALLLITVFFTASFYVRSRTLTMHQIQSSLALIEEHLKKMSQKD